MTFLSVRKLTKRFGGLSALANLDLEVFDSEILGIIGPNGAGKTTLFNVITGSLDPTAGKIIFRDQDITGFRADQVARAGITRSFQKSVLYMQATCFENVLMGFHILHKEPKWKAVLHTRAARNEESVIRQRVNEILRFMGLEALKDELAFNLPHGQQRALGICIALAANPKLLLLDEPATGLNPTETKVMIEQIRDLRREKITVVLVEHNTRAIMSLCDRIVVLNYGEKIAEGTPQEIQQNSQVMEAYLGKEGSYDTES